MKELQDILNINWEKGNGVVPRRFVKVLSIAFDELMNVHDQNDMQEFIALFVDKLNASIGTPPLIPNAMQRQQCSTKNSLDLFYEKADRSWLLSHRESYSQLVDRLYGQMVNQITCSGCGDISHVFDTFSTLMVSFAPGKDNVTDNKLQSIGDMIRHSYLQTEHISSRECDVCKNKAAQGVRVHRFNRLPSVLMISIKRFDYNMRKITNPVGVPEELDLSMACIKLQRPGGAEDIPTSTYKLSSIGCHAGNMGSGHYYAICKHPDGKWYEYDDDNVSVIDSYGRINSSHYYMLFYELAESCYSPLREGA
jgi:ubiquitin C-terminal hydrolase